MEEGLPPLTGPNVPERMSPASDFGQRIPISGVLFSPKDSRGLSEKKPS